MLKIHEVIFALKGIGCRWEIKPTCELTKPRLYSALPNPQKVLLELRLEV